MAISDVRVVRETSTYTIAVYRGRHVGGCICGFADWVPTDDIGEWEYEHSNSKHLDAPGA